MAKGGRRLYSEDDLKRLKVICFLRELDIPIDAISKILKEEHPEKVIGLLIEQQESVLSIKAPHCRQMTAARSFSLAYLTKTFAAGDSSLAVGAAMPSDIYCGGSSGNSTISSFQSRDIGKPAIKAAAGIRKALQEKGYRLYFDSPTNQIFVIMKKEILKTLGEKVEYGFWEKYDDDHTVIRFAADWGTTEVETNALIDIL